VKKAIKFDNDPLKNIILTYFAGRNSDAKRLFFAFEIISGSEFGQV